jgi:hypothetical protein
VVLTDPVTGRPVASVPLEAGLWAVALVVVVALILFTALRPVLEHRRDKETPVCGEPGRLGAHPLGDADDAGVRRCACGTRTSVPLVRTDTREHRWPGDTAELPRAREVDPDAPTDESPLPHIVWPGR